MGLTPTKVSVEDVKALCQIHVAKCALRREVNVYRAVTQPKRDTEDGIQDRVGEC